MIRKAASVALLAAALVSLLLAVDAMAQFDPGEKSLIQFGTQVGVLWVPERLPEACEYQEHWYLFPDYRYPGEDNPVDLVIQPNPDQRFENLEEFLDTMESEHPEGRYITTVAIEHREDCP
ncbi:MAG: hypothetical protein K0U98_08790 [Deltaproteobacteria bacterium]|nr:hypothetical protein [Deltaproteobacteria bacterium]